MSTSTDDLDDTRALLANTLKSCSLQPLLCTAPEASKHGPLLQPSSPIVAPLVQTLLAQKPRPCKSLANQDCPPLSTAHDLIRPAWICEQTHRHHPGQQERDTSTSSSDQAGKRARSSLTDVQAPWSLVSTPTRTSSLAIISTSRTPHPIETSAPTTLLLCPTSTSDRHNCPRSCPSSRPRICRR